jgi:hypothetical protein
VKLECDHLAEALSWANWRFENAQEAGVATVELAGKWKDRWSPVLRLQNPGPWKVLDELMEGDSRGQGDP